MTSEKNITLIFNQLSKDSQKYLLTLANMAQVAEAGKKKELLKHKKPKE